MTSRKGSPRARTGAADPDPLSALTYSDKEWRGAAQLIPLLVDIASITLDPQNARLHPDRNLDTIERSLQENGQVKPIVVREGIVYAGNGLVQVAIRLGWTKIAAVDVSHLSKAQARAYGLMDNRSGDLSQWDFQRVADVLKDLPEELLDMTGFDSFARDEVVQRVAKGSTGSGSGGSAKDTVSFEATPDQAEVIRRAIGQVKSDAPDMSDGRALELISADFLSGA